MLSCCLTASQRSKNGYWWQAVFEFGQLPVAQACVRQSSCKIWMADQAMVLFRRAHVKGSE